MPAASPTFAVWSAMSAYRRRGPIGLFFAVLAAAPAFLIILAFAIPAAAQDRAGQANRLFLQALVLVRQADASLEIEEQSRLLREADRLLGEIVERLPDTQLAVQIATNQFIGDFDVGEFRSRVRGLVCNDPVSTTCFLFRIEQLLQPIEYPITVARWDWLSLAVAYHVLGEPLRAGPIITPFYVAHRRASAVDTADEDLFVARALALVGRVDLAAQVTRRIGQCSARIYNLVDIAKALLWRGERDRANQFVNEAQEFAGNQNCAWEFGLVAQALSRVGREAEARTLFLNTVEQQFSRFRDPTQECCPPELAVAAAELGDVNVSLRILRTVQDDNPWAIPAVLGRLAARGETMLGLSYAEQVQDPDLRAESLFEILAAVRRPADARTADDVYARLRQLTRPDGPGGRRPVALAQRAKAEKLVHGDERWRLTFLSAINAADRGTAPPRRDIGVPLAAALVRIETGNPLLD